MYEGMIFDVAQIAVQTQTSPYPHSPLWAFGTFASRAWQKAQASSASIFLTPVRLRTRSSWLRRQRLRERESGEESRRLCQAHTSLSLPWGTLSVVARTHRNRPPE